MSTDTLPFALQHGRTRMFGRIVRALGDGRIKIEAEVPMSAETAAVFLSELADRQKEKIASVLCCIRNEMEAMG